MTLAAPIIRKAIPHYFPAQVWRVYADDAGKAVRVTVADMAAAEREGARIFRCRVEDVIARYVISLTEAR